MKLTASILVLSLWIVMHGKKFADIHGNMHFKTSRYVLQNVKICTSKLHHMHFKTSKYALKMSILDIDNSLNNLNVDFFYCKAQGSS